MATRDPLFDVAGNLGSMGLTLRGVAEGLRRVCDRGTDKPFTNEDHCLISILYERLEDEAATLKELEKVIADRAREGARAHSTKGA
jgi:hypothetical protein